MTFKLGTSARFSSLQLGIVAIAACSNIALGPIGVALTGRKKRPQTRVVGCPIRGLNGPVETPTLLKAWDQERRDDLFWEGWENESSYSSPRRPRCRQVEKWGQNAGGAQAVLLMAAIAEVFDLDGDSGFGPAHERTFHRPLPLAKTAKATAGNPNKSAQKIWEETCDWVAREYGATQSFYADKGRQDFVTLYRGVTASLIEETLEQGDALPCRVAESWTTDYHMAIGFAERNGGRGYVIEQNVPVKDILLTWQLHNCLNTAEEEILVATGGELTPESCSWRETTSREKLDEDHYQNAVENGWDSDWDDDIEALDDPYEGDAWDGEGFITPAEILRRKKRAWDYNYRVMYWYDKP